MKINRMDNLDLLVKDVDEAVNFYHGILGLPFRLPYVPEEKSAAIDLGNVTIYIFQAGPGEHEPRRSAALIPDSAPGYDSIALAVDNLEEAMQELEGRVEWAVEKPFEWNHPSGSWSRFRPLYDPDGNMLYLTEMHMASS